MEVKTTLRGVMFDAIVFSLFQAGFTSFTKHPLLKKTSEIPWCGKKKYILLDLSGYFNFAGTTNFAMYGYG